MYFCVYKLKGKSPNALRSLEFKTILSSLKAIYPLSLCFSEQVKSEDKTKTKWGNSKKIMVKALQKKSMTTKSQDSYLQLFWKHQSDGNKPENCIHVEQGRRKIWQLPKTRGRLAWCCPCLSHRVPTRSYGKCETQQIILSLQVKEFAHWLVEEGAKNYTLALGFTYISNNL